MDWKTINFDWNQARAFLVTAKEGSLSAAAESLRLSQPTLSRQVSGLEDSLGIALFEKSGRGIALTPAGIELLEHVENMGYAATELSLGATSKITSLKGRVTISAPEVTSLFVLPKVFKTFPKSLSRNTNQYYCVKRSQ